MKYGTVLAVGDPRPIPELARAAEEAGWDAIFLADTVWSVAPWVTLAYRHLVRDVRNARMTA